MIKPNSIARQIQFVKTFQILCFTLAECFHTLIFQLFQMTKDEMISTTNYVIVGAYMPLSVRVLQGYYMHLQMLSSYRVWFSSLTIVLRNIMQFNLQNMVVIIPLLQLGNFAHVNCDEKKLWLQEFFFVSNLQTHHSCGTIAHSFSSYVTNCILHSVLNIGFKQV